MPPWCMNAYSPGADPGQGRMNAYGPGADPGQGRMNAYGPGADPGQGRINAPPTGRMVMVCCRGGIYAALVAADI